MCRSWNRTSSPWSCSLDRFHPQSGPSCENTINKTHIWWTANSIIAPNIWTKSWGHSITCYCVSIFGQVVTRVWPRLAQHSGCVYLCFWIFADLHVLCRQSDLQVRSNPWSCHYHSLSLSAVTHAPFHASVLKPTSWPNAQDPRDGKLINAALLSLMRRVSVCCATLLLNQLFGPACVQARSSNPRGRRVGLVGRDWGRRGYWVALYLYIYTARLLMSVFL